MSSSHRRIIKMKRPISRVVVVPTHGQNTQLDVMDGSPADFLETHPDMLTEIPDVAPEPPGVRISEEALEQIRAEAYDQGLQDGAQHAAEEARRHLDKTFQTLNGMIDTIAQHQQIIYRHSEAGCVELVFAMVEKVVGALDHSQKQTIHWGAGQVNDDTTGDGNKLWSEAAPVWMYVVLTILLLGVWINYLYTIIHLFKIKKEGKELDVTM